MKTTWTGFAFTFLICAPAYAVQTFSPPAINNGSSVLACLAQNLGDQPITVDAVLMRSDGTVADAGQAEIPAGQSFEIISSGDESFGGYCAFTFDADAATLRGYIHQRPEVGGDSQALFPAFEAPAGPANEVQTFSAPLRSISNAFLGCIVQNLGNAAIDVETALIAGDGSVIDTSSDQVLAGRVATVLATQDDDLGAYCRFAFEGNSDQIRGYIALFGVGADEHLIFPASTADPVGSVVKYSPPVLSPAGAATTCVVQNLGVLTILQVATTLIDSSGTVLDSSTEFVLPGDVETVAGVTDAVANGICKFQFGDDDNLVRGYISRYPSGLFANTDLLELAVAPNGIVQTGVTTFSPPVQSADNLLMCTLENLGEDEVAVHVEIDDGTGVVVAMQDVIAEPGRGQNGIGTFQDLSAAVCRFTFDGSPDDIRGFATLRDNIPGKVRVMFAAAPPGAPLPISTPTSTMRPTFTHTHSPTATAMATDTVTPPPTSTVTPSPSITPTLTPTATPTPTHTSTNSPTDTPTSTQTATDTFTTTPTSTATETPTVPALLCVGDCDGDASVTVDEILRMVNIALGASIDDCLAGDSNGDEDVTVDEILTAVTNALDGCP